MSSVGGIRMELAGVVWIVGKGVVVVVVVVVGIVVVGGGVVVVVAMKMCGID